MAREKDYARLPRGLVGIVAGAAAVFSMAGYFAYRHEARVIRAQKYEELSAISRLKAGSLAAWRQERLDDVRQNAAWLAHVLRGQRLRAPGDVPAKSVLAVRLRAFRDEYGYANIILASPDGRVLLSFDARLSRLEPDCRSLVASAMSARRAAMGDVFLCPLCGGVHLDTVAPVAEPGGRAVAALILRTDPDRFLYPLVQSWPVPSRSAETLLVRRDGGDALFLNKLRHRADPPLSIRIPLSRTEVPAVQAVLGKEGIFEGLDYRGTPVLSDVRALPGTPWFMVSKVDTEELLSELRYRAWVIAAFALLGVLLSGGLGLLLHGARERRLYRDMLLARQERDEAVARSEQMLRAAMDSALDAVVLMDDSGRAAYWNSAAEKAFGFSAKEVVGKDVHSIFAPERYRVRFAQGFQEFLKTGAGPVVGKVVELSALHKDGREIPIEMSVAPMPRDGKYWSIGVIRDISERKRLERQREELFQFLSHDLKGPLGSVLASVELVHEDRETSLGSEAGRLLAAARRNCNDLIDLIRVVLDRELFSGSMRTGLLIQPLDPEDHVRRMVETMEPSARMRKVRLRTEYRSGAAKVAADRRLLYRVVTNLLSNAIKFSPEGGEVLVGLSRDGSWVRFEVSDGGPGIPEDFRDKVFSPRAQARLEDATRRGGAGLGLAGVRQMVAAMGGEIGFESVPDVRTTFFARLPAAEKAG